MKLHEMVAELYKEVPDGLATPVQVVFQDMETGEIFDIEEIKYQPADSHEGSTDLPGATVFIRGAAV